jgi:hypothetical protein
MSCERILEKVYEMDDSMSLFTRIRIGLHIITCPDCAQEVERFEVCKDILRNDFMQVSLDATPSLEDTVMAMVAAEETAEPAAEEMEIPGGLSTRGWVIAGLVMFVSLATAFFGLDFNQVAVAAGISFLIPVGITIGIVLTCYGALFIGSHLKEFTERFGLQ